MFEEVLFQLMGGYSLTFHLFSQVRWMKLIKTAESTLTVVTVVSLPGKLWFSFVWLDTRFSLGFRTTYSSFSVTWTDNNNCSRNKGIHTKGNFSGSLMTQAPGNLETSCNSKRTMKRFFCPSKDVNQMSHNACEKVHLFPAHRAAKDVLVPLWRL